MAWVKVKNRKHQRRVKDAFLMIDAPSRATPTTDGLAKADSINTTIARRDLLAAVAATFVADPLRPACG